MMEMKGLNVIYPKLVTGKNPETRQLPTLSDFFIFYVAYSNISNKFQLRFVLFIPFFQL